MIKVWRAGAFGTAGGMKEEYEYLEKGLMPRRLLSYYYIGENDRKILRSKVSVKIKIKVKK